MPSSYALGAHFESLMDDLIRSGRYNSKSEILRDGLRVLHLLVGVRVDQHHFERRVLEHAVEALRVHDADGEHRGVHEDGNAQRDLQGAQGLQVHGVNYRPLRVLFRPPLPECP